MHLEMNPAELESILLARKESLAKGRDLKMCLKVPKDME